MTDHIDTARERAKLEPLTGYTPGPWAVGIDDDGNPLSGRPCVSASEDLDCGIVHWDGFVQEYWRSARGDKEILANAHLIAAAPSLLATVHRLLDALDSERGRAEKAEAERASEWRKRRDAEGSRDAARAACDTMRAERDNECAEHTDTLELLDQALARLAAVKRGSKCARCGSDDGFGCYECIPPADAEDALQRVVDEAWNDAIETAAREQEAAYRRGVLGEEYADHIRALKRPEASHD